MTPELKSEWISALRSGDYKQCKKKLWDSAGGYCCLGVLYDILWEKDEVPLPEVSPNGIFSNKTPKDNLDGFAKCVGVDAFVLNSFAVLNDAGMPFTEIANMIEANASAASISTARDFFAPPTINTVAWGY